MENKIDIELQTAQLEQVLTDRLQLIANYTAGAIPEGWGFAVIICPMDEYPTSVLYVSNADQVGMLETVEKWVEDMKAGNYHFPTDADISGGTA